MGGKNSGSLKPGQTANPNGRPKKEFSFASRMREYLATKDPELKKERGAIYVENVFKFASKGDATSLKLIANYIDGMPSQAIDHTSKGEKISPILSGISTTDVPED